jgi:hypothetical protein
MASSYSFGIVPKGLTRGHRGSHMYVTFNYGAMPGCCGFHVLYGMYLYSALTASARKKMYPILAKSILGQLIGNEEWANPEFTLPNGDSGQVALITTDYTNGGHIFTPVSAIKDCSGYAFKDRPDQSRAIIFTDVIENVKDMDTSYHRTLGFYNALKDIDGWHFMNTVVHNSNHSVGRGVGVWLFNPPGNPSYSININDLKVA